MSNKRVLVVDDDPDLLFLVAHGVKSLASEYQVNTAPDGVAAINQIQNQKFDLMITDYMMPGMSGLELVRKVNEVSPETECILMTAHHDTSRIRNDLGNLKLSGFLGKPFTMPELLEVVQQAISQLEAAQPVDKVEEARAKKEVIQRELQMLSRQTGAHSVLLVNANGLPMGAAGNIDRARAARLATFVSTNFLAVAELASLFGDHETVFKSSYYEGNRYNIYSCDINGRFFLAVVFDARNKPGTVWFYTKQVATTLAGILPGQKTVLNQDASAVMARDFKDLLGDD